MECPECNGVDFERSTIETEIASYDCGRVAVVIPVHTCVGCGFTYRDGESEDLIDAAVANRRVGKERGSE